MTKPRSSAKQAKLETYCKYCKKLVIGNAYKFKAHLFKHNAIQERYNCKVCLKKFFRLDAYKVHLDRHNGTIAQKTYVCDYCDRVFVIRNNLITHLKRIHDESIDSFLGDFKCIICDLSYCERRLLDRHIRKVHFNVQSCKEPVHTNKSINETWIENVVNRNATVSITKVNNNAIVIKQLKIDVKVKDTTYKLDYNMEGVGQYSRAVCDYCQKEMVKKSLRTHIKEVHMNIRKFQCKVCKENFSRNYQLVEHSCGQFKSKKRKNNNIKKENKGTTVLLTKAERTKKWRAKMKRENPEKFEAQRQKYLQRTESHKRKYFQMTQEAEKILKTN